jgi:hypothetical protein
MAYVSGDIGWLMTGNVSYRLEPGVGMQKRGSDGGCMGWLEVGDEVVDGVGNGTSTGSTHIGEGSHATGTGAGGIGAGAGAGAVGEGADGG